MAKMKVHELAKELGKQSKELIAFLQDKGYEVKVAQSSIEDEAIELVRGHFGGGAAVRGESKAETKEAPKAAAKAETEQESKTAVKSEAKEEPKKTAKADNKETPKAAAKAETKGESGQTAKADAKPEAKPRTEPPKKKKIIFVSNPHNSKMQGQRAPQGGNGGNRNNDRRPAGNGGRPVQAQNAPHQIIRPTQKPIPVTAEPYDVRQKQQQERRMEQRQQEKIADLKGRADRGITVIRAIAKAVALGRSLAAVREILTALREAMAGRTIDLRKVTLRRTLCPRRLSRTWKNIGTRRSVGLIRRETDVPRKI